MYITVTFNPSLDYIISVDSFKYAGLNRATEEHVVPGGKGINVSIVLSNLGKPTKAFGFTGGFTGEALKGMVKERGVDFVSIPVSFGETRINVKLKSGEETEINGKGPALGLNDLEKLEELLSSTLQEGDVLILSGNVPSSLPKSTYRNLVALASQKGAKAVVDAEGELLLSTLDQKPFLIKPNKEELSALFQIEIRNKEEALPYARELQKLGARNVLVSLGSEGALLLTEAGSLHSSPAPTGVVKNSVGAGDSMVAGFLAGLEETHDYQMALKTAVAAGSATAFSGMLTTREELQKTLSQL